MKRIEPNLLLAISTVIPLVLLMVTATVYGEPGPSWRYPLMAAICIAGFVILQQPLLKLMKQPDRRPMINPQTPSTAIWASLLPALLLVFAAIPVFVQGPDFGLLVIMGAVLCAQTIDSAIRARPAR
ncbi:hypothetical protein BH10PSE2_BH10PSE2_08610 [soil metagenome]